MRERERERGQVRRDEGKAGMRRIKIQRTMMLFELKREGDEGKRGKTPILGGND